MNFMSTNFSIYVNLHSKFSENACKQLNKSSKMLASVLAATLQLQLILAAD